MTSHSPPVLGVGEHVGSVRELLFRREKNPGWTNNVKTDTSHSQRRVRRGFGAACQHADKAFGGLRASRRGPITRRPYTPTIVVSVGFHVTGFPERGEEEQ